MIVRAAERNGLRTWVELDGAALARNVRTFRRILGPNRRIMAVAKSNAYGHGLYDLVPLLEELGIDAVGVDSIVEAVTLRRKGVRAPILVMGHTLPSRFADAARHGVSLTVSSLEGLKALTASEADRRIRVHVKIDTGLHRQGFLLPQLPRVLRLLQAGAARLEVEGLYTHFAAAKDPARRGPTLAQVREFESASAAFAEAGFHPLRHASATAGTLNFPEARYDMARIGIGLMGCWPSTRTKRAWQDRISLRPVLSWRTLVAETKDLPAGAFIGYDLAERLKRASRIGVCPVGYWHGYPLALSGKGRVLVRGREARVLGRVSMDMIVIDLTGVPGAGPGDIVTLIGRDRGAEASAEAASRRAGTSVYELLTRLNPLLRKIPVGRSGPN